MTLGIMLLDMLKLGRAPKSINIPIQMPHPIMDMRESTPDILQITLEMLYVNGIESDDCRE